MTDRATTRIVGAAMNTGTTQMGSRRMRVVKVLLLQAATTALVVACGGGGGYGDDDGGAAAPPPPPPAPVVRDAQFTDDIVSGLRFSVVGAGEGVSNDVGRFQFVEGRKIDFLAGSARSEEHTSELQSRLHLVCRLLLEKKKNSS